MSDDFDTKVTELRQQLLETARGLIRRLRGPGILLDGSDLVQQVLLEARLDELLRQLGDERTAHYLKKILKYEFTHAVRDSARIKRDRVCERPLCTAGTETLSDP